MKLKEFIKKRTENWIEKISNDEWFFSNLEEELLRDKKTYEVFEMIPEIADIVLEEKDDKLCGELFELLFSVVNKSQTTEMPKHLEERWHELEQKISNISPYYKMQFEKFKRWYRVK